MAFNYFDVINTYTNEHAGNASSYTTPVSVSLTAGKLYFFAIHIGGGGLPSSFGGTLGATWEQVATVMYNSSNHRIVLYKCVPSSNLTGTIVINLPGTASNCAYSIDEWTGADAEVSVVQSATNNGSSNTMSVTLAAFLSSKNGVYSAFANNAGANGTTPGTGFTELSDTRVAGESHRIFTQYRKDNDTSVDATSSGTPEWGGIAVEIRASANPRPNHLVFGTYDNVQSIITESYSPTANSLVLASVFQKSTVDIYSDAPAISGNGFTWEQVLSVTGERPLFELVDSATETNVTPAAAVFNRPTDADTGDIVVLLVGYSHSTAPTVTVNGSGSLFTAAGSMGGTTGTAHYIACLTRRIADIATEPTTYSVSVSETGHAAVYALIAFRGVLSPISIAIPAEGGATVDGTKPWNISIPDDTYYLRGEPFYFVPASMFVGVGIASTISINHDHEALAPMVSGVHTTPNKSIALALPVRKGLDSEPLDTTFNINANSDLTTGVLRTIYLEISPGRSLAENERLTVFRAAAASPTSGPLTVTFPSQQRRVDIHVVEFSDVDSSNNGANAITQSVGEVGENLDYSISLPSTTTQPATVFAAIVNPWSSDLSWERIIAYDELEDAGENLHLYYNLNAENIWSDFAEREIGGGIVLEITPDNIVTFSTTLAGDSNLSSGLLGVFAVGASVVGEAALGADLSLIGAVRPRVPTYLEGKYSPEYSIWLVSPNGHRIGLISEWERLEYARRVNHEGNFVVVMKPSAMYDLGITTIEADSRIEIYRSPVEGFIPHLETETSFLVRKIQRTMTEKGQENLIVSGPSAVQILARRIAAYAAGHSHAEVNAANASYSIVKVVRENFGTSQPDLTRDISDVFTPVQVPLVTEPTVVKEYSHRNILTVIQELSDQSVTLGDPTYFDVVRKNDIGFEFRTYQGQRGVNRGFDSGIPLEFSAERGNFVAPTYEEDYTEEVSFVYAGGQGQEEDRLIVSVEDKGRTRRSPFGLIEAWVDARNVSTKKSLASEARGALKEKRARVRLTGKIVDTPTARYGIDWFFGDRVITSAFGLQKEVLIQGIHITVNNNGSENIEALLEDV